MGRLEVHCVIQGDIVEVYKCIGVSCDEATTKPPASHTISRVGLSLEEIIDTDLLAEQQVPGSCKWLFRH